MPIFLLLALVLVLLPAGCGNGRHAGQLPASGTVEATEVNLAPKVSGRVLQVPEEGAKVEKGAVIIRLESDELQAAVQEAQAALKAAERRYPQAQSIAQFAQESTSGQIAAAEQMVFAAQARLAEAMTAVGLTRDQVRQQIQQARAARDQAEAQFSKAGRDEHRAEALFADGFISAQALDAAKTAAVTARANAVFAKAALQLAEQGATQVTMREQEAAAAQAALRQAQGALAATRAGTLSAKASAQGVPVAQAQVQQAQAVLARAQANLANATLTAPITGYVTQKMAEVGELVPIGMPVITLADLRRVWVSVYVPEAQLGLVKLGQPADVTVDSYPGATFHGTVGFISSQAEFTPKNVQTKEDRVTLTFKVKAYIDNKDDQLKPGMPADVVIQVGP